VVLKITTDKVQVPELFWGEVTNVIIVTRKQSGNHTTRRLLHGVSKFKFSKCKQGIKSSIKQSLGK
jgi:hypothetical protein